MLAMAFLMDFQIILSIWQSFEFMKIVFMRLYKVRGIIKEHHEKLSIFTALNVIIIYNSKVY